MKLFYNLSQDLLVSHLASLGTHRYQYSEPDKVEFPFFSFSLLGTFPYFKIWKTGNLASDSIYYFWYREPKLSVPGSRYSLATGHAFLFLGQQPFYSCWDWAGSKVICHVLNLLGESHHGIEVALTYWPLIQWLKLWQPWMSDTDDQPSKFQLLQCHHRHVIVISNT